MSSKASILSGEFARAVDCAMTATSDRGSLQAAKLISLEMSGIDTVRMTSCDGIHYAVSDFPCEGSVDPCSISAKTLAMISQKIGNPGSVVSMEFDNNTLSVIVGDDSYRLRYSASDSVFKPGDFGESIATFNPEDLSDAIARSSTCLVRDDIVTSPWTNVICLKPDVEAGKLRVNGCDTRRGSICKIEATNLRSGYVALIPFTAISRIQKFVAAQGDGDASLFIRGGAYEIRTQYARFGGTMTATEYPPITALFDGGSHIHFQIDSISAFVAAARTAAELSDEEMPSVFVSMEPESKTGAIRSGGQQGDAFLRFPASGAAEKFEIKARSQFLIQAVQSTRFDKSKPLAVSYRKDKNALHFKGIDHDYMVMGMLIPA